MNAHCSHVNYTWETALQTLTLKSWRPANVIEYYGEDGCHLGPTLWAPLNTDNSLGKAFTFPLSLTRLI